MTRKEAIRILEYELDNNIFCSSLAMEMAIEALKAQEWDEFAFDMKEFFSIIDNGKIIVMRKGRGRVTVERPVMRMETTICSYGKRREE